MKKIDWYYDFISPYAYFTCNSLEQFPEEVQINPKPILLAGILKHYETKGAGEIPPMRKFTYRQIQWLADRHEILLQFPPMHPFNPLKLLRLSIALGGGIEVVTRLFHFVWGEGKSSDSEQDWHILLSDLGMSPSTADTMLNEQYVKDQLMQNTQEAVTKGLFGVPAFVVDQEVFWGFDSMAFVNDYLKNTDLFNTVGMQQADSVGSGVVRA